MKLEDRHNTSIKYRLWGTNKKYKMFKTENQTEDPFLSE